MPKNNVIDWLKRETVKLLENWVLRAGLLLLALWEALPRPDAHLIC